jgi:nitroreductase
MTHHERPLAAALAEAAAVAGYAPSIHNTQPWRWRVQTDRLELFADRSRQLKATDPDGKLLTLSCGTALHHVRLALAAEGQVAEVRRFPEPSEPDLLAEIVPTGAEPVTPEAMRLVQTMELRHTDRRPVRDEPVPAEALAAVIASVAGLARLHLLTSDQVLDVAAAATRAGVVEAADPQIREELAYWTGRAALPGTGLPSEVLPAEAPRTTVPARDFGTPGTLPIGRGHDRAAVYAVLFGDDDEPQSWLRAGEALSAAWLTATDRGVSMVPLSGAIEVSQTRETLRHILADLGYPYLVLRLGSADPDTAGPPHTPRMPAAQVVDTSAVQHIED